MASFDVAFNMYYEPEWEDKEYLRRYGLWLFDEQARSFLRFLGRTTNFAPVPALGRNPYFLVKLREPGNFHSPVPTKKGWAWHFEYPLVIGDLERIPFVLEQSKVSKLLGETGDLPARSFMPVFDVEELTKYLHTLAKGFFAHWRDHIGLDPEQVTHAYEKYKAAGYRCVWVKAKAKMPELNATVELEFDHSPRWMRKYVVTKRQGEVIDRKLIVEQKANELFWTRTFKDLKVDGRVISVDIWRYEIFGEASFTGG